MKTYISLLRGINVSGQKKILMADLKAIYEGLGFTAVQTYIQSGNVVFSYKSKEAAALQKMIFDKIQSHYGFDIPNLILSPTEIKTALSNNPYNDIDKPYLTFLSAHPLKENITALANCNFDNEFYELKEKVIYAHFPNGAGKAKMNNNLIEKKLKISATTRNLRTTKKLLEICTSLCNSD